MGAPADDVLEAVGRRDWDAVRLALHPYLHWDCEDGTTVRGRSKVLAMLRRRPAPEPPSAVELRDGQVYRWMR